MRISQTTEQISALRSFQDHCEIESISLLSSNARRAKTGVSFVEPYSVRPSLSSVSSAQDGNLFIVDVSFDYSAWDSSEPSMQLFQVACTFEVCYRLREDYAPTEEEKTSFSRGTAVFNCWPYAREFFRDITARLGQIAPALPLLRIIPKQTHQPAEQQPVLESPKKTLSKQEPKI